jgi:hypothetical protein
LIFIFFSIISLFLFFICFHLFLFSTRIIFLVFCFSSNIFGFFVLRFPFFFGFLVDFTDTFFTLDVYLGHNDAVRVVDPELGKLEREKIGHDEPSPPHGMILGTTSTSTRRHTRRESNPGET